MTSEMKTFVYKNGRPDHMEGYHDDLLMALGMILWVVEHSFKKLQRLEKQNKSMLNAWLVGARAQAAVSERDRGTGFVSNENRNKAESPRPKIGINGPPRNMQDPTGQYAWLFRGMK
jgi:hypothetical protein